MTVKLVKRGLARERWGSKSQQNPPGLASNEEKETREISRNP